LKSTAVEALSPIPGGLALVLGLVLIVKNIILLSLFIDFFSIVRAHAYLVLLLLS